MTAEKPTPIPDDEFMKNVVEARDNGFDFLCAYCGVGLYDESDIHDRYCSLYVSPVGG